MNLTFEAAQGSPAGLPPGRVLPVHRRTRMLLDYWTSKRHGDLPPARGDFQPREIVALLPHMFISEPVDRDWRLRLFGTALCAWFGADLTGRTYRDVMAPEAAEEAIAHHGRLVRKGSPSVLLGAYHGIAPEPLLAERVCLPMLAPDGFTVWVIGGVFFLEQRSDAAWPGIQPRAAQTG